MGLAWSLPEGSGELSDGTGQVAGIRMVTNYVLDSKRNMSA
jgi:hypothetical protein